MYATTWIKLRNIWFVKKDTSFIRQSRKQRTVDSNTRVLTARVLGWGKFFGVVEMFYISVVLMLIFYICPNSPSFTLKWVNFTIKFNLIKTDSKFTVGKWKSLLLEIFRK